MNKLKIVSIFRTIDGEVTKYGPWAWTTFVRTGGCNLRCWKSTGFCDAPHTLDMSFPYPEMDLKDVVEKVLEFNTPNVTFSGGEPWLWKEQICYLANVFKHHQKRTSLETSGSLPFTYQELRPFCCVVMDVKPPSTEMAKKNVPENMEQLRLDDYTKFVIADREDFLWSIDYLAKNPTKAKVAFGVRWGYLEPRKLLGWIESNGDFNIQFNMQSHKIIFPECHPEPVASLKMVNFEREVSKEH